MDDLPKRLGIPEADWVRTPASVQVVVRALVQVIQDQQLQLQTALRDSATNAVTYLHGDHLGSVSVTTNASGTANVQEYDPWGRVRAGSISATSLNFTGQRLDGTGLLDYHARMDDPVLARFVSADSVVPGSAAGSMDGVQLRPLTVDFHEPGFAGRLNSENGLGFWFQMSDDQQRDAGSPWGPANPQALNRYSYVQNAPVRYRDPSGHSIYMSHEDAVAYADALRYLDEEAEDWSQYWRYLAGSLTAGAVIAGSAGPEGLGLAAFLGGAAAGAALNSAILSRHHTLLGRLRQIFAAVMAEGSGKSDVIVSVEITAGVYRVTIINRETGNGQTIDLPIALGAKLFGNVVDKDNPWRPGRACTLRGTNPGGDNFYSRDHTYCQ